METPAFITYMAERLNATLTRENIRDMINIAQNEILSNDNRITRIVPDPFLHTGSDDFTGHATNNTSGAFTFEVNETIPTTTPTRGYLLVTEGGITDRYKYVSYSGKIFTLADGVSLSRTYTSAATVVVDDFTLIASGAIFSSRKNDTTTQFDVRRVTRVYAFRSRTGGWPFGYSRFARFGLNNTSFRPDRVRNINSPELEVSADTFESFLPNNGDCEIEAWRENTPGNTTDVYMCRAQRWADQVLTEDVPLTIPGDHWQTTLLKWGILKDVEYTEYGRDDNPQDKYDKALIKFLTWAAAGVDTTTPRRTLPRPV
jgi:hypothetical protein